MNKEANYISFFLCAQLSKLTSKHKHKWVDWEQPNLHLHQNKRVNSHQPTQSPKNWSEKDTIMDFVPKTASLHVPFEHIDQKPGSRCKQLPQTHNGAPPFLGPDVQPVRYCQKENKGVLLYHYGFKSSIHHFFGVYYPGNHPANTSSYGGK